MKAYIALSQVRKANDILIADIMSPALFSCGAHPWPTRLLQVLRGQQHRPSAMECKALAQQNMKRQRRRVGSSLRDVIPL